MPIVLRLLCDKRVCLKIMRRNNQYFSQKTPKSAAKRKKSTPKGYMYLTESDSSEEERDEEGNEEKGEKVGDRALV